MNEFRVRVWSLGSRVKVQKKRIRGKGSGLGV